jgi:hypothetical protein
MKKLVVLIALLALVPVVVPAQAHSLTLGQRVTRLEAKMNCLTRTPVYEYTGYAWYGTDVNGNPTAGPNGANTYNEADSGNPDSLRDQGWYWALDWYFPPSGQPQPQPDYWVMSIKTSPTTDLPIAACVSKFAKTPTPTWWKPAARMMHLRQLSRVQ